MLISPHSTPAASRPRPKVSREKRYSAGLRPVRTDRSEKREGASYLTKGTADRPTDRVTDIRHRRRWRRVQKCRKPLSFTELGKLGGNYELCKRQLEGCKEGKYCENDLDFVLPQSPPVCLIASPRRPCVMQLARERERM